MADYKKSNVWRKVHAVSVHAHRAAMEIRGNQYASLRSQMIRAAMSVPGFLNSPRTPDFRCGYHRS